MYRATAIFGTTASTSGTTYTLTTLNASGDTVILGQGNAAAYSAAGQILNIGTLNGSANFVVNTDLVNGKSDVINITTAANSTANTIRVNYDPSANLGEDATGPAVFATDASSQAVFTAVEGEIGAYSYIPTISSTAGTTTTWSITGLTIIGASEAVYAGLGRAAYTLAAWRDSDAPLYTRMAELRQGTAAGLWAAFSRQGQSVDNLGHGVSGTASRIDLGWDKSRGSWHYGIGATFGRQTGKGTVYLNAQLVHDFAGGAQVSMQSNGRKSMALADSLRGTWLDLRLGWRQDIGSRGSWYCEAGCRAMGGETHRDWGYRAGIDWKF